MEFNGTFFVTIISFVFFVFVMNKILYKPVADIVTKRQEFVDGNLKSADENRKKVGEITSQKEAKLSDARNDAREKYNESINDFKAQKNDIVQKAQWYAGEEQANAEKDLNKLSDEVKDGLKDRMTDLANDIVEKVIGYRSEVKSIDKETVDRILWQ